jgi:ADP-ribose pyrophosphatase YjhB (NUDIX family)
MTKDKFEAIVVGIIFDPKTKKILIGRREKDPHISGLKWCFPGGRLKIGDRVDATLKKHVKNKTGYEVKNLGAIFSKIVNEKEDVLMVYFLTQVFAGEEKPGDDIVEIKWVSPKELRKYFTSSFNKKLEQYLTDLV